MEILGKILYGQDNKSYMLQDFMDIDKCSKCNLISERPVFEYFELKVRKYDFTLTYDGYTIVSIKFVDFCKNSKFLNLEFLEIPKEPNFFVFSSFNIVKLDHNRRKTKFEEYCNVCKRFYSVGGASPNFFENPTKILRNTIYRSDIEYGYGKEQHPIFIVNLEIFKFIKAQKFSGIFFTNILR